MAFVWKPAIYRDSTLTWLPRPVEGFHLQNEWDKRDSKVPLKDGISTTGHSQNGRVITIRGNVGWNESGPLPDEGDALTELEAILTLVDISADSEKFELFIYHDAGSATYRKFKECSPQSFTYAIGEKQDERVSAPYDLVILAEDPVLYSTAPGV